ncbi:MAG: 23S rRNA (adenine(2503)-C(2))-methyltransferase RlmN [Anaerolineae bacterium]|nr:23S rRNA (adenine(2503)-C(2))-methyltransferase RlmN [Anaerolineae bacterium]
MINLYDLTQDDLSALLAGWGEPGYRARQVWTWLYKHKAAAFDAMSNLPKDLRARLSEATTLHVLEPVAEQHSIDGETVKWLFELYDGQLIESVLMHYEDERRTACISTQAGCAMGCVFCATGQMGFARHLSAGEIVAQVVTLARRLQAQDERLSNVVLMGMGEPLHNYDATLAAIRTMIDPDGLGIGQRHITVSTVGLVPAIRRLAREGLQVRLAVSLHAADDAERSASMPVNRKYPVRQLIAACRDYFEQTGRRVTFEWALIYKANDTPEHAEALAHLLKGLPSHVNLIPLNPTGGFDGAPSSPERVDAFRAVLESHSIPATVRVRRGIDIQAGCGQLKTEVMRRRKGQGVIHYS